MGADEDEVDVPSSRAVAYLSPRDANLDLDVTEQVGRDRLDQAVEIRARLARNRRIDDLGIGSPEVGRELRRDGDRVEDMDLRVHGSRHRERLANELWRTCRAIKAEE